MTLEALFFAVARMSGNALGVAIAVALLDMLFVWSRRIRQRLFYYALLLVAVRLVCPAAPESPVSIFNLPLVREYASRYAPLPETLGYDGDYEIVTSLDPEYERIQAETGAEPQCLRHSKPDGCGAITYIYYTRDASGRLIAAPSFAEKHGRTMAIVWLCGTAALLAYGGVSYLLLRRRVSDAVRVGDNVYESDRIKTAFILGIIRPRIYLPRGLDETARRWVLAHEREHIRHGDHIAKAAVYCIMCVHWFNLLLWCYFYNVLKSLIETACDDDVTRALGRDDRADYGEALVALGRSRHFIGAVPCAFGEGNCAGRVKAILNRKKDSAFINVLFCICFAFAAVCCLTGSI